MKNKLLITLFAIGFTALIATEVQAKHHSRVNFNVGVAQSRPAYVVHQPAVVMAPAPIVMQPAPTVVTYPNYYAAPTYVVQPQPVIVAQPQPVIVTKPAPRPFFNWANFGFSFSL